MSRAKGLIVIHYALACPYSGTCSGGDDKVLCFFVKAMPHRAVFSFKHKKNKSVKILTPLFIEVEKEQ